MQSHCKGRPSATQFTPDGKFSNFHWQCYSQSTRDQRNPDKNSCSGPSSPPVVPDDPHNTQTSNLHALPPTSSAPHPIPFLMQPSASAFHLTTPPAAQSVPGHDAGCSKSTLPHVCVSSLSPTNFVFHCTSTASRESNTSWSSSLPQFAVLLQRPTSGVQLPHRNNYGEHQSEMGWLSTVIAVGEDGADTERSTVVYI